MNNIRATRTPSQPDPPAGFGDQMLGLVEGVAAISEELRHAASIPDDLPGLTEHVAEVSVEPVSDYMCEPRTVDIDETSAINIAEQLLHSDVRALAVVEDGRYIGTIGALRFCWLVYRSLAPTGEDAATE